MKTRPNRALSLLVLLGAWVLCSSCVRQTVAGPGATLGPYEAPARTSGPAPSAAAVQAGAGLAKPSTLPEKLPLSYCFDLARRANKDVWAASLGADAAEAGIMSAKGEFDATVFAQGSAGRTNIPVAGVPLTEESISQRQISAGIRKRFITGTDVELDASTQYVRDLTGMSTLNPQHETDVTLSVRQDLLKNFGIGINRTDISLAEKSWASARQAFRDSLLRSLFEVESAYWDLYFAIADLKVREMQLERANKLVQRAESQVKVGEAAPIEVTRAKSSAAAQAVSILNAQNDITKLRRRLLKVMGVLDQNVAQVEFELADSPGENLVSTSLSEAFDAATKSRPDYIQATLAVESTEIQRNFARNQRLPTLQLFGDAGVAGLADNFSSSVDMAEQGTFNSWEAGLFFEWPIPNRTARGNYRAATFNHERAKVQLRNVAERVTREVADALSDLKTAEGRIASAREAGDLAERLLQAEEKSFTLGRSNSVDVLLAQEAAASAERDVVQARTDYATAVSNLLRVEGLLDQK